MLNTPPPSVLIVLLGSVGDVARALIVATEIKKQSPTTKVGWVISSRFASLITGHTSIDHVHTFNEKKFITQLFTITKQIRQEGYAVCLDLQRIIKSGVIAACSGATRRIGFHAKNSKEGNYLFQTETIEAGNEEQEGKLALYVKFITALGLNQPTTYDFGLKGRILPSSIVVPEKFIGVILSSRWKTKDWHIDGYIKSIQMLLAKYPHQSIVLLGGNADREREQVIQRAILDRRLHSLVGKTSLQDLPPVIERASVLFGPDSGPLHIASSLDIPYVSLFGPTSALKVHPHNNIAHAITTPLGCTGCYLKDCPDLGALCMKLITPHDVVEKIGKILSH